MAERLPLRDVADTLGDPDIEAAYWVERKFRHYSVNHKTPASICDFGATEGNEVTDEILEGIATCADEGRPLEVPPGQWGINEPLNITTSGFQFRADSAGLSQIVADGSDYWASPPVVVAALVTLAHPDCLLNNATGVAARLSARTDSAYRVQDVEISGIHFVGPWAKGITSLGAENIRITRCKFTNYHYEVVWPSNADSANVGWLVDNNVFVLDNDDVNVTANGSVLEGNFVASTFSNNRIYGGYIGIGFGGSDNKATGNTLRYQIATGISVSDAVGSGQQVLVSGNSIYMEGGRRVEATQSHGIVIAQSAADVTVVGNTVHMKHVGVSDGINGISVYGRQGVHIVSANTVTMDMNSMAQRATGIRAEIDQASDDTDVSITNNKVRFLNESTAVQRYGVYALVDHASATMRIKLSGSVRGVTDTNDGFAFYLSRSAGTLHFNVEDFTKSGGQWLYGTTLIGAGSTYFDNRPLRVCTADGIMDGRNNMTASTAPTENDDISLGYIAGKSEWWDNLAEKLYRCIDDTYTDARWWNVTDGVIVP